MAYFSSFLEEIIPIPDLARTGMLWADGLGFHPVKCEPAPRAHEGSAELGELLGVRVKGGEVVSLQPALELRPVTKCTAAGLGLREPAAD